jgi:large subunit ribosomal protein L9
MPSHVQIILRQDVDNLGVQGELVRVRPGYARNYLIPRGLAVVATRENAQRVEHERRLAQVRAEKIRQELQSVATKIEGVRIQIAKEAGDEGKLFGSVTAQEIAEALEAKTGLDVDRKKIVMPEESIKQTGPYEVSVKMGRGVVAAVKLDVTTKA